MESYTTFPSDICEDLPLDVEMRRDITRLFRKGKRYYQCFLPHYLDQEEFKKIV